MSDEVYITRMRIVSTTAHDLSLYTKGFVMSKLPMQPKSLAIGVLLGVLPDQLIPQINIDPERWTSHLVNGANELFKLDGGQTTKALIQARHDFVLAANVPDYLTVRMYDFLSDMSNDEDLDDNIREDALAAMEVLENDPAFKTHDQIAHVADAGPVIEHDTEARPVEATPENASMLLGNVTGEVSIKPTAPKELSSGIIPVIPIKPDSTEIGRIQLADQIKLPETAIQIPGEIREPDSGA